MQQQEQLLERFKKQAEFTKEYSPLYHTLFSIIGDWLDSQTYNPVVEWLLEISADRSPFDVPLLLLAGLHREILLEEPGTEQLGNLYPSVSPDWRSKAERWDSEAFSLQSQVTNLPNILHRTIWNRREALEPFIKTATVQTNETGRGIVWLLPALLTNWEEVHLVDLGASAGLNLLADQRFFRILNTSKKKLVDIGDGKSVQFMVTSKNTCKLHLKKRKTPKFLSRTGCDVHPFYIKNSTDEATLTSYVWADQLSRIDRLKEGINAFRRLNTKATAPVTLYKAELPDELPTFLEKIPTDKNAPVVIYNTFMTTYLDNKGATVREHLTAWAEAQDRPVLWLQAEPPRDGKEPPEPEWLAWTADLWQNGEHQQWQLGWIQPHGTAVYWLEEQYQDFVESFKE